MLGSAFNLIIGFLAFIVAITVHEFSHAWAAEHLGDPTPRLTGRLTLNPLHHIDLFGTILLPLLLILSKTGFVIGWAKPVVFDPFNLRNPRRDGALISIAGPCSNILLACLCAVLFRIIPIPILSYFLAQVIVMNVMLATFNLVPIHPLDGFKIVEGILPEEQAREWHGLERFGMIFLIFLLFPFFGGTAPIQRIISPIINFLINILLPL